MFPVWHDLFSVVLTFPWLRTEAPLHLLYAVSVSTNLLKRGTRKLNFCSYVLNLVLKNISFHLSKIGSPEVDLSAIHA